MQGWIERQPRWRHLLGYLTDPNISVQSVRVSLVTDDPVPVGRETDVAVRTRYPNRARRLSAAVKPSQLRKGRTFSRLRD